MEGYECGSQRVARGGTAGHIRSEILSVRERSESNWLLHLIPPPSRHQARCRRQDNDPDIALLPLHGLGHRGVFMTPLFQLLAELHGAVGDAGQRRAAASPAAHPLIYHFLIKEKIKKSPAPSLLNVPSGELTGCSHFYVAPGY